MLKKSNYFNLGNVKILVFDSTDKVTKTRKEGLYSKQDDLISKIGVVEMRPRPPSNSKPVFASVTGEIAASSITAGPLFCDRAP